ncbi:serine hydrolase domain-containing protein [Paenibacillus sp. strain BS8-2]
MAESNAPAQVAVYGQANYRSGRELTRHSLYELASVTKPLTATAIQRLAEQGRLQLDDPLVRWIPKLPYPVPTIRHALTHTSGLPDYMELLASHYEEGRIYSNDDVIDALNQHVPPTVFEPGSQFEYSNTAYVCLATIIEEASGQSFANYMDHELFQASGMKRSRVYNRRINPHHIHDLALGWVYEPSLGYRLPDEVDELSFVITLDGIQGDGTVHSTLDDLHAFDSALRSGKLLSPASQLLSTSPMPLQDGSETPCGLGWFHSYTPSGRLLQSHSGGWPGYWTRIVRDPQPDGRVWIVLANLELQDRAEAAACVAEAERLWFI